MPFPYGLTAVAEDVDVGKGNVHRHGAELATFRIVVKGISDFVHQGDSDFWFTHIITP